MDEPHSHIPTEIALWFLTLKPKRCFYCGVSVPQRVRTKDHLVARSKGGSSKKRNLVCACIPCNQAKSNMSVEEFRVKRYAGKMIEFFGEYAYRTRETHTLKLKDYLESLPPLTPPP